MKILFALISLALFTSCQINPCGISKAKFLSNYEKFVDEAVDRDLSYEAKAWDQYDDRFEKYVEECYPKFEDDLTRREQREFTQNSARYLINRYGVSFLKDLKDDDKLQKEFRELGDRLGEYTERYGQEISDAVSEFVDQIDKEAIEDAMNEIGKFFEDLEINFEINTDKK